LAASADLPLRQRGVEGPVERARGDLRRIVFDGELRIGVDAARHHVAGGGGQQNSRQQRRQNAPAARNGGVRRIDGGR
jgi:hypothetical protein